jgi:hypothetical protein
MGANEGKGMSKTISKALDLNATLRQVRDSVITVECSACGRSGHLARATLIKKHGAGVTVARLRRIAAMGCDRLVSLDGDRCETRFPCLDRPSMVE